MTLVGALLLSACGGGEERPRAKEEEERAAATCEDVASEGGDVGGSEDCIGCHAGAGAAWTLGSSHALLHGCTDCHEVLSGEGGQGHASRPDCASCHSEETHRGEPCTTCHEPHGSSNLFLVRTTVEAPDGGTAAIALTVAQGLADGGLAGGTGAGLCEACHRATDHYDRWGSGEAHESDWCVTCHDHADGFSP